MSKLFEEIGEREFEKLSKNAYHTQHKKLLFSLSFLHALLNGRSKFETLGWLQNYTFELSDFYVREEVYKNIYFRILINIYSTCLAGKKTFDLQH